MIMIAGRTVAEGVRKGLKYNGSWGGMNDEFKDELEKTIEYLLEPEKISKWIKKINSKSVNGSEFFEYIKLYFKLMKSDQLLKVQSIYDTLIEKEMNTLVDSCVQKYMEIVSKNKKVIQSIEHIATIHESSKSQAICIYIEAKKMGDTSHEGKFRQILDQRIEFNYEYWRKEVEKNIKKVEKEKKKVEEEMKNKYKRDCERIENEKRRMEQSHKDELKKLQSSFQKLKLSKDDEIQKLKRQVKEEREAQEREFKLEKLKALNDLEKERAKNEAEIAELKFQLEQRKEELEQQVEFERLKRELDMEPFGLIDIGHTIREIDQRFTDFQMNMFHEPFRSIFGMRLENYSDSDSD